MKQTCPIIVGQMFCLTTIETQYPLPTASSSAICESKLKTTNMETEFIAFSAISDKLSQNTPNENMFFLR